MARQASESWSDETPFESAGGCGVIARLLGMGALVVTLAVVTILLVTGPPNRWQGIADPSEHPLALITDPQHPQDVFVGTEQGRILISENGGRSWSASSHGLPPATPVSALALLPSGQRLLAGTSGGVYLSSDRGQTWRSAGPGIPRDANVDAVSALPDGVLLAGTTSHGVYVLPVGGATWLPAIHGLPAQSDIYAFLSLAQRGHVLAALISGGVYASQDDGMTWAESDQGLKDVSGASGVNVFSLLAIPGGSGADMFILAGTSRGMFLSRDNGATWAPSSTGIGTTRVISLARDPLTPTDVFAGTDTGVYQSRDAGATWRPLGLGLPAEQHVGAVGVIHPPGDQQVVLASVDQLYRYPGDWLLASQPWRTLGLATVVLLALTLGVFIVQWARSIWPARQNGQDPRGTNHAAEH